MNEIRTEDEQVEALKKWWKDNGTAIIVGLAIALSAVAGYKYWQKQKLNSAYKASAEYSQVIKQLHDEPEEGDIKRAEALIQEHNSTVYAGFTAMTLAKVAVDNEDYDTALTHLNSALNLAKSAQLKPVINFRIAQIQYAKGNSDLALQTLGNIKDKGQEAQIKELQADIYNEKGDQAKALTLYKESITILGDEAKRNTSLQLKYKNLGGKES